MFFKNKEQSNKEELDEIKELVKSNNEILISAARAKKIKLFIKLVIFGAIIYFAYSTYGKIAGKIDSVKTNVEEKLSFFDKAANFLESVLPEEDKNKETDTKKQK